jgi:iron complex outermembrane receptor protein
MRHVRAVHRLRAVLSAAACAAVATSPRAEDAVEIAGKLRVEVTGSNIPRTAGETGLPLQVITGEELRKGGVQTTQELLERISANQSYGSWNTALGENNTVAGFTGASLRGLGSERTLVLLDGHRIAPYALAAGQGIDVGAIPVSMIDRVEILKDGASAIYGTDAVGGVINFILRRDYQGVELNANAYVTEHPGGNNGRVGVLAGTGDLARDGWNAFIFADYYDQQTLKAAQRESTKTAFLPDLAVNSTSSGSFPANITQRGGFGAAPRNPTIPFPAGPNASSCFPPVSFAPPATRFVCAFDFASVADAIPPSEQTNLLGRFTWRMNADHQFFAEAAYYHGDFIQRTSPTPVSGQIANLGNTFQLLPSSPYYPAAFVASLPGGDPTRPVSLGYRTVELGTRNDEAIVDALHALAGIKGTVRAWDYELSANYTMNHEVDHLRSGYVSETGLAQLIRSGVVNPFGPNDDTVLAQMRATQIYGAANDNRASNYGFDFKASGDIYRLSGGPVTMAAGLQWRHEMLRQTNADFFASGDVLGGAGVVPSLPEGHRRVGSAFVEFNVPLGRTLEVDLAARYDRYSDFGSTTNPKLTLRWQPMQQLLLRGSYGTGFRAPTLSDLFQPGAIRAEATDPFDDPIRCPVTGADTDCQASFGAKDGGNPALQPEKSHQLNAGIVIEPMRRLSLSADYYRIVVDNVIQPLTPETIFGDYARWSAYVVRKPPDPDYPTLPGPIAYIVTIPINAGTLSTSGIDLDLRWRAPASAWGELTLSLTGTYVLDYEISDLNTKGFPVGVGTRGPSGAISRWRHYAMLDWKLGDWGATLANNFQEGYREVDLLTCDEQNQCTGTRHVSSYSVWDLQGRYTGAKNATLSFGIRNLFDTAPPVSNQTNAFQRGIDPSYADPRGRMYYVALRYAFR